jgi:uroporphyrinogen-III decarboxylase
MRPDYVKEIFDKQSSIAVKNLDKIYKTVGNDIDVVFICGTDFGTQESTFCDESTYRDLWLPYYQRINSWIHQNTEWKTFKHSCGAVESFMNLFIESGFDIINPVQINAKGMDSKLLKEKYGNRLTFWGGGIDTQKVLSFGTPQEVKKQTLEQCEVFAKNGGFVFNSVHNVQANTPTENMAAMIDGLNEFRGLK